MHTIAAVECFSFRTVLLPLMRCSDSAVAESEHGTAVWQLSSCHHA